MLDFIKTHLLDLIFIIVTLSFFISGWRKGFVQSISKLGRFVGAGGLSYLLGPRVGQLISEKLIYNGVFNSISEKIGSAVSGVASSINVEDLLDNLPDLLKRFVDTEAFRGQFGSTIEDVNAAAKSLSENISGSVSTILSNIIAYVLLFIAGLILFAIVFKILDGVAKLPVLNLVNRVFGAVLGLLGAFLFCSFVCELLSLLVYSKGSESALSVYAEASYVFGFFRDNKVFDILPKAFAAKLPK